MSAEFLSPDEVAELLGVNRKTVYREITSGRLKALRIGRVFRVSLADLEGLLFVPDGAAGQAPEPRGSGRSRSPAGEFSRLARRDTVASSPEGGRG